MFKIFPKMGLLEESQNNDTIFSSITKNLLKYQTVSVISKIVSSEIYLLPLFFFLSHMATSIIVPVIHGKLCERLDDINVVI